MTGTFAESELAIVRRAFARQLLASAGLDNPRLEQAFADVRREDFLGPPPWQVVDFATGYRTLPAAEPVLAYQDLLFALAPDRAVNNGSPSLHARWLDALAPAPGERVCHVGAGTGYYSAILARLVGPEGRVEAVEIDPSLAARARASLAGQANVEVVEADGALRPKAPVDCVYVNFATLRPAAPWLERLRPGGRLVFPLGTPTPPGTAAPGAWRSRHGAALIVTRREAGFAVRPLGPAYFVFAEGRLAAAAEAEALRAAFERGGFEFVRSLHWGRVPDPARCWYLAPGWALGYDAAE